MAIFDDGGGPAGSIKLGGLWQYLVARVQGRTLERLELMRNEATARVIQTLPPGAELEEYEADGRYRKIRMPQLLAVVPCSRAQAASEPTVLRSMSAVGADRASLQRDYLA